MIRGKQFVQGYVCAVASIVSVDGPCVRTEETLKNCGIKSIKDLRDHDVDENDIQTLRPMIRSMQRHERYLEKLAQADGAQERE